MFARYDFKAGSLAVNVVADVVKLLTGTTDKTLLSTDCVQASTVIIDDGSRPAGWTETDAIAGVRARAISAPNFDGVTFKHTVVEHNNTSSLFLKHYESWNPTTHVGTNLAPNSGSLGSSANLTLGGSLFISASARGIFSMGFTSGNPDTFPYGIGEHSRDELWDTPAFGVNPSGWLQFNNTGAYLIKGRQQFNYSAATCSAYLIGPYTQNWGGTYNAALNNTVPYLKIRDAGFNMVHAFCPLSAIGSIGSNTANTDQIILGKVFELYATTQNYGSTGDEVSFNGKTYFIAASGAARIAVPKF